MTLSPLNWSTSTQSCMAVVSRGRIKDAEIFRTVQVISADPLVLSPHGYTGGEHLFFGSDAENILEHVPCPVLVVR
ncbi:MAG TPA: universal stress protein [Chthoniobacterales bacterium]|nr:universal stress protein [Chthoniobacterales bacterium]